MTSDQTTRQRRKLLVLTSTFPRWENDSEPPFVFELCRRLAADFDVLVLAPHAPGARTRESMGGMTVVRFRYFFEWGESLTNRGGIMANLRRNPLVYLLVPIFMASQLLAAVRLLREGAFDLVHAHWLIPQGLLAVFARLLSRRNPAILCTSHGSDISALRGTVFAALQRFTLRHADAVTVVSKAMSRRIDDVGVPPEKVSVLPMGVDARNLFRPDEGVIRSRTEILFVGRLTAEKGIELLIRALPAIMKKSPETFLTVIGQGPAEVDLRQLCVELGITHKVGFVGAVPNESLPQYFRRAALFVLPSHAEGFGLVCAEAMACECAVVASDLPALREMVSDRETGLLFSDSDMQALTRCVLELLADNALRVRLGTAGRAQILERYDWEVIARGYRELLLGLPSNKHPRVDTP